MLHALFERKGLLSKPSVLRDGTTDACARKAGNTQVKRLRHSRAMAPRRGVAIGSYLDWRG